MLKSQFFTLVDFSYPDLNETFVIQPPTPAEGGPVEKAKAQINDESSVTSAAHTDVSLDAVLPHKSKSSITEPESSRIPTVNRALKPKVDGQLKNPRYEAVSDSVNENWGKGITSEDEDGMMKSLKEEIARLKLERENAEKRGIKEQVCLINTGV